MAMVEITGHEGITYSYHVDNRMKNFLDKKVIPTITKKDKDFVMLVDGYEGAGKSTFAMQIGKYVDHDLDLTRVCFSADEFKQAILGADKGQCVIYDEAVTGLTAGESITRVGRLLKSLMMQMRQKNLFVIVILPSVFELNKYAVLSRARCLFHIYEKMGRMGYWVGYNKRDTRKVYLLGKKTHSYRVRSLFNGRFYGKTVVPEEEYRTKKEKSLEGTEDEEVGNHKWMVQRDFLMHFLKEKGVKASEIAEMFEKCRYPVKRAQIYEILSKNVEKYMLSPLKTA